MGEEDEMRRDLATSAVVVVANFFNPSVVNHLWLVRNGLLGEDELQPNSGSMFTDALVQVLTARFALLVTPEQLQFMPAPTEPEPERLIVEKVGRLVEILPHTPFRALGLNFTWQVKPETGDLRRLTRQLFYKEETPLYREFSSDDANFGAYLSRDFGGFRLKLDIRPITVPRQESVEYALQMLFNYHADLDPNAAPTERIHLLLRRWREVSEEARRLVDVLIEGAGQ